MAANLSITVYIIPILLDINSHYISEITLDIINKNIILMEEWTIGTFWGQVQFLFLYFSRSPHFEIPQNEM